MKKNKLLKKFKKKDNRRYTLMLDVDGCIFKHFGTSDKIYTQPAELLPGVLEKFNEWDGKGYNIILTTGRKESLREITEKQLKEAGLVWDRLIMGIGGGRRILINDLKPNSKIATAVAINLERDKGFTDIDLDYATVQQNA